MSRVTIGAAWVEDADGSLGGTLGGRLSGRELSLFRRLAQDRGEVVPHAALCSAIWGEGAGTPRRLKALVQRLRNKLEPDPSSPRVVLTALRQGYQLVGEDAGPSLAPAPPVPPAPSQAAQAELRLPSLIGRQTEQARLEDWLFRRRGAWLTLTGVGGVGKSALLAWSHARALIEGLTCFRVSMGEVTSLDALYGRIAHAGRIVLPPDVAPEPVLAMALRTRPGLWLLDDLSQLDADAVACLDRLFSPLERVRVLATGRFPLQSLDEVVFPVAPLSPEAAAALFRVVSPDPGCALPQRLPRLPLWVRLAAAAGEAGQGVLSEHALIEAAIQAAPASDALELLGWHPEETDATLLAALLGVTEVQLEAWRRKGLVELLDGDRVRVHPVIREALQARSARADPLGRDRRRQLERLIAYVQTEAASSFASSPLQVRRRLVDYLDRLLSWSRGLRPSNVEELFRVLPVLVRVIAGTGREAAWVDALDDLADRLRRRGEPASAARLRLAVSDISDPISAADQQLRRLGRIDARALSDEDRDLLDVMVATVHARIGGVARAAALLAGFGSRGRALLPATRVRYRLARSRQHARESAYGHAVAEAAAAVEEARSVAPMLETAALLRWCEALREAGRGAEVGSAMAELEAAARRWDDHAALIGCLRLQARDAIGRGDRERALERASMALARSHPGSSTYVHALYTAAVAHRMNGAHAHSERLLEAALEAALAQSDRGLVPTVLDSLASARMVQGDLHGALELYARAASAATELGDDRQARRIHGNMAQTCMMLKDFERAVHHQELGRIEGPAPTGWVFIWTHRQAMVMFELGKRAQARDCVLDALELDIVRSSVPMASGLAILVATWLLACGDAAAAEAICTLVPYDASIEANAKALPEIIRASLRQPGALAAPELCQVIRESLDAPCLAPERA